MRSWAYTSTPECLYGFRSMKTWFGSMLQLALLVFLPSLFIGKTFVIQKVPHKSGYSCTYNAENEKYPYPYVWDVVNFPRRTGHMLVSVSVHESLLFPPSSSCHSRCVSGNQFAPILLEKHEWVVECYIDKRSLMHWQIGIDLKDTHHLKT